MCTFFGEKRGKSVYRHASDNRANIKICKEKLNFVKICEIHPKNSPKGKVGGSNPPRGAIIINLFNTLQNFTSYTAYYTVTV